MWSPLRLPGMPGLKVETTLPGHDFHKRLLHNKLKVHSALSVTETCS